VADVTGVNPLETFDFWPVNPGDRPGSVARLTGD
jgi:hypothetical protein